MLVQEVDWTRGEAPLPDLVKTVSKPGKKLNTMCIIKLV